MGVGVGPVQRCSWGEKLRQERIRRWERRAFLEHTDLMERDGCIVVEVGRKNT